MAALSLTVNGQSYSFDVDPTTPLLYVLMDDLQLNGPKFGCGLMQCGACTVLLDGQPIRSCTRQMSQAAGHSITTIEGLGTPDNPHPIQTAFIEEQAAQCAFCISGVMLYGKTYVDAHPGATEQQIAQGLPTNLLCRCYSHVRMLKALARYAQEVQP
jgi:nicotinate dehydrogenase subunit A